MSYALTVDPWALRHCLAAVLPFREEVPAVKTLRYYTRYVPPSAVFKYQVFSTTYKGIKPIYIDISVYFRAPRVYLRKTVLK